MAILEKHPKCPGQFQTGDAVTPKVINDTIDTAIDASNKAKSVCANLQSAVDNAQTALAKATNIETRANSGEFNGVMVDASGLFGFKVENGNLVLCYSGSVAPNLSINTSGELILNI